MGELLTRDAILLIETAVLIVAAFWLVWRSLIQPDIISQLEQRLDKHRQELDELREAMTADREELAEMRIEMAEWRAGMRLVFEQLKAANITPVWQPRERTPRARRGRVDGTLAGRIAEQFNIDEINGLAYDIGILPEEIGGETLIARSIELVDIAARRGISAALVGRVNELRRDGR